MLTAPPWLWQDGVVRCRVYHRGCSGLVGLVAARANGAVVWICFNDQTRRSNRPGKQWRRWRGGDLLVPPQNFDGPFEVPETLTGWCPKHGLGSVSTLDVIGGHGKIDVVM